VLRELRRCLGPGGLKGDEDRATAAGKASSLISAIPARIKRALFVLSRPYARGSWTKHPVAVPLASVTLDSLVIAVGTAHRLQPSAKMEKWNGAGRGEEAFRLSERVAAAWNGNCCTWLLVLAAELTKLKALTLHPKLFTNTRGTNRNGWDEHRGAKAYHASQ
jgi:hypothetical protein